MTKDILPYDGEVSYYGIVIDEKASKDFTTKLLNTISWRQDEAIIFGKKILTKRKVAWYGDKSFLYTYSKTTKKALPWTKELLELKNIIESLCGEKFNSCLLNLYHDGKEGMAWHSDKEKDLKKGGAIASFSLGEARRFSFKHKESNKRVDQKLENGSLLVMKGKTQEKWLHSLPKSAKVDNIRINLTFRIIDNT